MILVVLHAHFLWLPPLIPLILHEGRLKAPFALEHLFTIMINKHSEDPKYVTWAEVFHPETATLAPQVRELHPDGNEWGAVWAEATLINDVTPSAPIDPSKPIVPSAPIATVVTIDGNAEQDNLVPATIGKPHDTSPVPRATISPWAKGNFFSTLIGGSLSIGAVASTFGLEMGAATVYLFTVVFYHLFQSTHEAFQDSDSLCMIPVYFFCALFLMLATIFMLVDCILLLVSVLVSESLALITCLLCVLCGGCGAGASWHQYIRKLCHLTRWAFRSFHKGWTPERGFLPGWGQDPIETNAESTT